MPADSHVSGDPGVNPSAAAKGGALVYLPGASARNGPLAWPLLNFGLWGNHAPPGPDRA